MDLDDVTQHEILEPKRYHKCIKNRVHILSLPGFKDNRNNDAQVTLNSKFAVCIGVPISMRI